MRIMLDRGAKAPTRAHETDAGLDLYALQGGCVRARQSMTFRTGVHVELPENTFGLIMPKSGLMCARDMYVFGVIDQGYSGEIMAHVMNLGHEDQNIRTGDKVAQLMIVPVRYEPVEIVDEINGGERGEDGFGSTGVR